MDDIDSRIVALLRADGRVTHDDIGRSVGLSRPAVHQRVRRLERQGVIQGYTTRVDWGGLGMHVSAFVALQFSGIKVQTVIEGLGRVCLPDVVVEEAHRITGEDCMLLKVRAVSTLALQSLIDALRDIPGVISSRTSVVLSTLIEHGVAPPAVAVTNEAARLSPATREATV